MSFRRTQAISLPDLISGLQAKNRTILSKCITLIESSKAEDRILAADLLDMIGRNSASIRIGITGVPGVGKSTFIESLGKYLTNIGLHVAVLSIDPSSSLTSGSILGDKTRMEELAKDSNAFIRPSPSGKTLGGLASNTMDTILLCEAAGFDVILVETIGVGQNEIEVNYLVDYFMLLMLSGAGDDLQGIKRGIMEMADHIVINKADGDHIQAANRAKKEYENVVHLFPPNKAKWTVPVQTCSSRNHNGIESIWGKIEEYIDLTKKSGWFQKNRFEQNKYWLKKEFLNEIERSIMESSNIKEKLPELEKLVKDNKKSVRGAVSHLLDQLKIN